MIRSFRCILLSIQNCSKKRKMVRKDMTAQIILSNQLGIALASDTTVTSGQKTLQTVSKIVALPAPHRVAIMLANNVFMADTHVRLLLTEWIATLKSPLKSLEEYADDFTVWVGKNSKALGFIDATMLELTAHQELQDFYSATTELRAELKNRLLGIEDKKSDEFSQEIIKLIEKYDERNFYEHPYHDLTGSKIEELYTSSGFDVKKMAKEFVQALTEGEKIELPALEDRLVEFIKSSQNRFVSTSSITYFNFAGFGTQELWPCHVELKARSVYGGRLRAAKKVDSPENPMQATTWFPIAQQDAMADMLRGLSDERREDVWNMAVATLNEIDGHTEDEKKKFSDRFAERMNTYFDESFSSNTYQTLQDLSPSTLVEFAELLVKIQSLRSATQSGPVSVGGKIECLSITKESGTKWVSRMTDGGMVGATELDWLS